MPVPFSYRKVALGLVAGIISGIAGLALAYTVGVAVIGIKLRDFFATLLAAFTVLPLMLIFVLLLPTMVISGLVGLVSGVGSNFTNRPVGPALGAIVGLVCGEFVLSLVVPLIVTPHPGDVVFIASNRYLSGAYGMTLGALTSRVFLWIS